MISVPRALLLTLAALFSAYHLFLAGYSLRIPVVPAPAITAMVLFAAATALSLWPRPARRMPVWLASFNLAVCAALPLLVTSQLDSSGDNGYATWYVAAVGTLMTITATRGQELIAWVGVIFLAVHTELWSGVTTLGSMGVIGSIAWVGIAHVLVRALSKASRDARQFARAEREATEWNAAQDAHVSERQLRLRQTSRMAAPMLGEIVRSGGRLTEEERLECRYLEGAIRDEIRGRQLLNDEVRGEVMSARRRGIVVSMLDEGGIDDLDDAARAEILDRLAEAIRQTTADRLVIRTVPDDPATAVTVVGLSAAAGIADAPGAESADDEVDLWLEIPRDASSRISADENSRG